MKDEIYVIHRYDGRVFELGLKEIFDHFSVYQVEAQFGYGTDFGRCIADHRYSKFSFSTHGSILKVYYEYLFFITTSKGKLLNPIQVINEYCEKYDPTCYWYTGRHDRVCTGRKRRGGHCFRRVKTTAEKRAVQAVLKEEGEPEFRGRRRNVPSLWDDINLPFSRSWKTQSKRKKQYKGN